MYKLIRIFNQNRKKILLIVLIMVFIVILIQLLNFITKNSNKKDNINIVSNDVSKLDDKKEIVSDKSLISGDKVSESKLSDDADIINDFFGFCKNENIEKAYELISQDCKDVMFQTIDEFNKIYYDTLFNDKNKIYTIQNWINDTYKINFNENYISTGNKSLESSQVDYVTIVKDNDGTKKLNINNFIGKEKLDKDIDYKSIVIKAQYLYEFVDYCEISFDITNNTYRTILMDDLSNPYTIYIEDNNGMKYSAYTNELVSERLKLGINQSTQVNIRFYSKYSSSKKIKKVVFSKVINNFETYESVKEKSQYNQYYAIEVKL